MRKKKKRTVKKQVKRQGKKQQAFLTIDEQIWPMERDILVRPDRMKYVRKLIKTKGCVFCFAEKNEPSVETLCVHKTKHSMVILNKFPYNPGHLLVLPQRHCGDLLKLSIEEYHDLQELVREAVAAVQTQYKPEGLNLGLNHGAIGGAGIPEHLHYHIVPRWAGDVNFFPVIAETKVVVESLDVSFERLMSYFKKQNNSKRKEKK